MTLSRPQLDALWAVATADGEYADSGTAERLAAIFQPHRRHFHARVRLERWQWRRRSMGRGISGDEATEIVKRVFGGEVESIRAYFDQTAPVLHYLKRGPRSTR